MPAIPAATRSSMAANAADSALDRRQKIRQRMREFYGMPNLGNTSVNSLSDTHLRRQSGASDGTTGGDHGYSATMQTGGGGAGGTGRLSASMHDRAHLHTGALVGTEGGGTTLLPSSTTAAAVASPEMDLDSEYFNVNKYTTELLRRESLKGLVESDTRLLRSVRQLDSQLQELVYQNYAKFITATDTIREMRDHAAEMDAKLLTLSSSVDTVDALSQRVNTELQAHRSRIEETISSNRMLKKVQFLLTLPSTMRRLLEHDEYTAAVKYWVMGDSFLAKHTGIAAIAKIKQECTTLAMQLYTRIESAMCAFPLNELDAMDSIGALVEDLRLLRATSLFQTGGQPGKSASANNKNSTSIGGDSSEHANRSIVDDTHCVRTESIASDSSFEETVLQSLMLSVSANFHREVAAVQRELCATLDMPMRSASTANRIPDNSRANAPSSVTAVGNEAGANTSKAPAISTAAVTRTAGAVNGVQDSVDWDRSHYSITANENVVAENNDEDEDDSNETSEDTTTWSTPLSQRHELLSGADVRDGLAQLKSSCATLAANTNKLRALLLNGGAGGASSHSNEPLLLLPSSPSPMPDAPLPHHRLPTVTLTTSSLIEVMESPSTSSPSSWKDDRKEQQQQQSIAHRAAVGSSVAERHAMTMERYIAQTVHSALLAVLRCVVSLLSRRTTRVLRSIIHNRHDNHSTQHATIHNDAGRQDNDDQIKDDNTDASKHSVYTAASVEEVQTSLAAAVNAALVQLRYVAVTLRALEAHYAEVSQSSTTATTAAGSSLWFTTQVDRAVCTVLRRVSGALCRRPLYRVMTTTTVSSLSPTAEATVHATANAHSVASKSRTSLDETATTANTMTTMTAPEELHERRLHYALTCLTAATLASRLADGVHTTLLANPGSGRGCAVGAITGSTNPASLNSTHVSSTTMTSANAQMANAAFTNASAATMMPSSTGGSSRGGVGARAAVAAGEERSLATTPHLGARAFASATTTLIGASAATAPAIAPNATHAMANHEVAGSGGALSPTAAATISSELYALSNALQSRVAVLLGQAALEFVWHAAFDPLRDIQEQVQIQKEQQERQDKEVDSEQHESEARTDSSLPDALRHSRTTTTATNLVWVPSCLVTLLQRWVAVYEDVMMSVTPHAPPTHSSYTNNNNNNNNEAGSNYNANYSNANAASYMMSSDHPPSAEMQNRLGGERSYGITAEHAGLNQSRDDAATGRGGTLGAKLGMANAAIHTAPWSRDSSRQAAGNLLPPHEGMSSSYALHVPNIASAPSGGASVAVMSHGTNTATTTAATVHASQLSVSYTRQTEKVMMQANVEQIFSHETSTLSMSVIPGKPASMIRAALLFLLKGLVDRMCDVTRAYRTETNIRNWSGSSEPSDRDGDAHSSVKDDTYATTAATAHFQRVQISCTYLLRALLAPAKGSVGRHWIKEWNSMSSTSGSSTTGGNNSSTTRTIQRLLDELCTCAYERTPVPPQPLPHVILNRSVEQALMITMVVGRPAAMSHVKNSTAVITGNVVRQPLASKMSTPQHHINGDDSNDTTITSTHANNDKNNNDATTAKSSVVERTADTSDKQR